MFDEIAPPQALPPEPDGSRARRQGRRRRRRRVAALAVAVGSLGAFAPPASAGVVQVRGNATYGTPDDCAPLPPEYVEYTSYPPLLLTGDLDGCLWTLVETSKPTPSGVVLETGREVFVGTLADGAEGTFATTYRFEAKFDTAGQEIHGRCQHPIVAGSGTGGFEGVRGRLFFKDAPPNFPYRGHLSLP